MVSVPCLRPQRRTPRGVMLDKIRQANCWLSFSLPCPHSVEQCEAARHKVAEALAKKGSLTKDEIFKRLNCSGGG